MTFFQQLQQHAGNQINDAVVTKDVSFSYKDLLHRVVHTALGLQNAGVKAGDTVGLTLEDETAHLVVSLALASLGAGQITLASHDSSHLHSLLCERLSVSLVVSADKLEGMIQPAGLSAPLKTDEEIAQFGDTLPGTDSMLYLKTSGTTGDMNIVPFTETQIIAQARQLSGYSDMRLLRLASIEHNNSKRHRLYCALMGGTNVFRPGQQMDIIDFILRHRVDCLDISRIHASDIATMPDAHKLADVWIRTGGSAVPWSVREKLENGVTRNLYVRYAATECGAIAMACPGDHGPDENVGKPLTGVAVEIVDPEDKQVTTGEAGEIRLQAPGMADHYLDSPQDTANRFRHGWFYPGDMGSFDQQGRLTVSGRKDDMIVLNGVNIFPNEIEQVLEKHPDVKIAAALGLSSDVHGDIPVAAVELQEGADITGFALQKYAKEFLNLKTPRRILVMAEIPRNSQGKIMRRELAEQF